MTPQEKKEIICNMFGGESKEEFNALMSALQYCAGTDSMSDEIYQYLEDTPKTSLIVELVNALHVFGFKIIELNK